MDGVSPGHTLLLLLGGSGLGLAGGGLLLRHVWCRAIETVDGGSVLVSHTI